MCSKCFACSSVSKVDSEASVFGRKVVAKEIYSDEESDYDNEDTKLLRPNVSSSDFSATFDKFRRSSETIFDVQNKFEHESELEKDTTFVVNAMNESHASLSKLVSE